MTKKIECDCGWSVRSDREDELVTKAQEHAREAHHMEAEEVFPTRLMLE